MIFGIYQIINDMNRVKYKNSISDTLSNLVGDQGIRTDVSVQLTPLTIGILVLIIPITVAAGIIIAGALKKK
jgi:hypothetical protein